MKDEAKLDRMLMDTAILAYHVEGYLQKKGVVAIWHGTIDGVQMTRKAFLRLFDQGYKVEEYPAEGRKIGKKAVVFYQGVKFYTYLEDDE
jgi:hypothetical protein